MRSCGGCGADRRPPCPSPAAAVTKRRPLPLCRAPSARSTGGLGQRPAASPPPPPAPTVSAAAVAASAAEPPRWRVYDVAVPLAQDAGKDDATATPAVLSALGRALGLRSPPPPAAVSVVRKSFDARSRARAFAGGAAFSYVLDVDEAALLPLLPARPGGGPTAAALTPQPGRLERAPPPAESTPPSLTARPHAPSAPPPRQPHHPDAGRVLVVGGGPAGLFAALRLAAAGVAVTLLERGQPVERRGADIGALMARRILNPDSNLCYGEGGAGTWSDGKLVTRIGRNAGPVRSVLTTLVALGAPASILVDGKPHLGTDRLVVLLRALRGELEARGVTLRWGTTVERLALTAAGRVAGVVLAGCGGGGGGGGGEVVAASRVVLAPGHSARPLLRALHAQGVEMSAAPCAVGLRIEHPQALVDAGQYGPALARAVLRGKGAVPVADYRLVSSAAPAKAGRGGGATRAAFSFCMCPGGQVVPTSVDPSQLCVNGMSFSRRASPFANSGLVVPVGPDDYAPFSASSASGPNSLAGFDFQESVERAAALAGGGGLVCPVQTAPDFLSGDVASAAAPPPPSSYRLGVRPAGVHALYPDAVTAALRVALLRFGATLPGYAGPRALLHGVETRTSSPVRVERRVGGGGGGGGGGGDLQSPSTPGLWPVGEGCGHAGGIVSAAVDGIAAADAVLRDMQAVTAALPEG